MTTCKLSEILSPAFREPHRAIKTGSINELVAKGGPGSVAYGIRWLQALRAIVIDPERCPETAKEFSEYEYERDVKTGEVLEGYPDAANHSIDAARYALEPVWKRRGQ